MVKVLIFNRVSSVAAAGECLYSEHSPVRFVNEILQNRFRFCSSSTLLEPVIDSDEKLAPLLPHLQQAEWIAIDTEANSLYAYPPQLCLIQISIPDRDVILDPLAPIDLTGLFSALGSRELILHGADYDLRLLWKHFQFKPAALFDTMWAARFLGLTHLVGRMIGTPLEKGPQKMNWAKRPLTERMERYAKNDTHYLRDLSQRLSSELESLGRLSWMRELCDRLIGECSQTTSVDHETVWRIKGSSRLSRASLAVLRETWQWRESEAIHRNKPPYFVLSNESMIEIADAAPSGRSIAHAIPPMLNHSKRAAIKASVERGLSLPSSDHPAILRQPSSPRLTQAEKNRYESLKKRRDQHAEKLNLDPSIIASRLILTNLAREIDQPEKALMRWQRELLL
jgi:ribonuclease D